MGLETSKGPFNHSRSASTYRIWLQLIPFCSLCCRRVSTNNRRQTFRHLFAIVSRRKKQGIVFLPSFPPPESREEISTHKLYDESRECEIPSRKIPFFSLASGRTPTCLLNPESCHIRMKVLSTVRALSSSITRQAFPCLESVRKNKSGHKHITFFHRSIQLRSRCELSIISHAFCWLREHSPAIFPRIRALLATPRL